LYPCPCGYFGDPVKECTCSLSMVSRYQKRISGPLLDRMDIHIEVPRVDYDKLSSDRLGEPKRSRRIICQGHPASPIRDRLEPDG
jgi:magnesium chelatase family protein